MTFARSADFTLEDRAHCLELIEGHDAGHRFIVGAAEVSIGRTAPADIVLADSEVSRTHCRLVLQNGVLTVTDLNSTNGTYIDNKRIDQSQVLAVGSVLRVGNVSFEHEVRTREQMQRHQAANFDHNTRPVEGRVAGRS